MKGTIWTVTIVLVLAGVMFVGVSAQYDAATVTTDVVAEEHTLSDTEPITLEAASEWSSFVHQSEVVRTDGGETLTRDDDYEINNTNGEITSSPEYDGEPVEIDYQYRTVDEDTEAIAAALEPLAVPITWLVMIAAIGALLAWLAKLPSGGGSW